MAAPLKLSAIVTLDASQVPAGAQTTKAAIATIGEEAGRSSLRLQQLIDAQHSLGSPAANQNVREWTGALAMQGRSLDELRAKYNPLFAVINQYKTTLTEIRTLHAQGVLSTDEMTAAIQRQRQATLASIDVIKGRNVALADQPAPGNASGAFQTANIAAQFQDIGVTAALGMSPLQIALQQGTQLSSVLSTMDKPVLGLVTAFRSLVSPVSLVTIGLVAASAAAIQYFMQSDSEAKKANDALDKHGELIRRLRDAYGDAAKGARDYGTESRKILTQDTADSVKSYRKILQDTSKALLADTGTLSVDDFQGGTYILGQMQSAVALLRQSAADGTPDIEAFVERIIAIENHPAVPKRIREMAEELRSTAREGVEAQRALSGLLQVTSQIGASQRGFIIGSQGERDRDDYLDQQRLSLDRMRAEAAARQASLTARSPKELAAAARANAAARAIPDESAEENSLRIELAGREALLGAEKQLTDARRDRLRSLEETIGSQQLEASLISRTVSEAEALRMEFQLTAQLRAEAARNGVDVDQQELELIRQKSRAYGQLTEQMAAINMIRGQDENIERLRVEQSLIGANDTLRARTIALLEAEQEIRRTGIASDGAWARQIRANADAMALMNRQIEKQAEVWEKVKGSAETTIDSIVDGLSSGDISGALEGIAKDIAGTFLEIGVKNPLKNAMLGTDYGTLSDIGGLGAIVGRLFGQGQTDPSAIVSNAMGRSVGSMSVMAGTVVINGGIGGLGGSGVGSMLGGAANSNVAGGYSGLAGNAVDKAMGLIGSNELSQRTDINSFLRAGGVDIDAATTAWCAGFVNSALKQVGIDGSGSLTANSFQNWGTAIDPSQLLRGDVLLQSRGLGAGGTGGHVGFATGASRMVGGQQQLQMLSGNSDNSVATSWINASELQIRRATEASASLASLAGSTGAATQNLGVFGNGLGQLSNGLSQIGNIAATGGASSGGGFFSSLLGGIGKLFGGVSPTSSAWAPNTTFGSFLVRGFSGGGDTGGSDPTKVAGVVHEKEYVFDAISTAAIGVQNLDGLRRMARIGGKTGFDTGGYVASVAPVYAGANNNSRAADPYSAGASERGSSIVINNYGRDQVQAEERTDEQGRRQTVIQVGEMTAGAVAQRGNPLRRSLQSEFGMKPQRVAR
jgi:uncharacterized protein (TIGR02594 family)